MTTEKLIAINIKVQPTVYRMLRMASATYDKTMQEIVSTAILKEIARMEKAK